MANVEMAAYFAANLVYAASPGPLMAVLVARSLGNDWKGACAFAAGLCIGEAIAVAAVLFGLGIWAQTRPEILAVAKYAGIVYLLWLAVKLWNDNSEAASAKSSMTGWATSALAGLALCLGNPVTLLMQLILLPIVAPAGYESIGHAVAITLVAVAAFGIVFFGTIPLARQINMVVTSPAATRRLNRGAACTIAATGVWIALV